MLFIYTITYFFQQQNVNLINVSQQVGGATALIGDPTGKTKDRVPMDRDVVAENVESITHSIKRIFHNHEKYFWHNKRELPRARSVASCSGQVFQSCPPVRYLEYLAEKTVVKFDWLICNVTSLTLLKSLIKLVSCS